ncbi:MAG: quinol:cytochrome C oxidoreductase, partial [Maribacter sp.]
MYTFSNRLKIGSIILMAVGLLGIIGGFVMAPGTIEEAKAMVASHDEDGHGEEATHASDESHAMADAHGEEHGVSHDQHLLDQLQNKPWAALYVAAFFFFMIALGVLAFYAIQRAAQAGWSPLLFRVMEGITSYLVPGGIIVFVILLLSVLHMNHLFIWMDAD